MRAAMMIFAGVWMPLWAHAECTESEAAAAVQAVVDDELSQAMEWADQGIQSVGCGSQPVGAREWATLWQVHAAVAFFQDQPEKLEEALSQAVSVSPDWFEERLGADLKEQWERADLRGGVPGQVRVHPLVEGARLYVDGQPAYRRGAAVLGGRHLVQVTFEDEVVFTRVLETHGGERVVLDAGLKRSLLPNSPMGWGIVGAGGLAMMSWGGAAFLDRRSLQATELAQHDSDYAASRAMAGTAVGLGVTAAVLWSIKQIRDRSPGD